MFFQKTLPPCALGESSFRMEVLKVKSRLVPGYAVGYLSKSVQKICVLGCILGNMGKIKNNGTYKKDIFKVPLLIIISPFANLAPMI